MYMYSNPEHAGSRLASVNSLCSLQIVKSYILQYHPTDAREWICIAYRLFRNQAWADGGVGCANM